jgi:hypothetical protein
MYRVINLKNSTDRSKLVILAVVGLLYSLSLAYLLPNLPAQLYSNDFFKRWYASKMLLTSGRSLYDPANASELVKITGWPHTYDMHFYYPANLLFITAPLAPLPYRIAIFIWIVFGLWCLWLSMIIFAWLPRRNLSVNRLTLLLVLVTTSVPVLQHTIFAQFNTLGMLALALTYWALYQRKYLLAGLWAGGLLFKPQATLLPLLILLLWSLLEWERRSFWIGLLLIGGILWGVPELLEPNWVFTFRRSLANYQNLTISSVADKIWNPYQGVSFGLVLLTLWFTIHLRRFPATSTYFSALLAWTINLTALIVPLYAMMHMVLMGPVFVILLKGYTVRYPGYADWFWWGTLAVFIAGIAAFVIPLLLAGPTGLQVVGAEAVYRFTLPVLLALASLPLLFDWSAAPEAVSAA